MRAAIVPNERCADSRDVRVLTRVELAQSRGGRGKLVIHYHSADELEGILDKIR